ncbi:hypothetical protein NQ314_001858 [Rhamnusium bicolor]|uniref:Uncharacterized protein n=1 Tax=Rhamnusium bicolor TaxID=1586634 RepID=A0AAV8ZQU6_9CUCU|nr:hypothetical protein NQ314_001858 [Rhamnusium bicolor]
MFMQDHIGEISNRTGTLHVHLVSGRYRIYAEKTLTFPRPPATNITTFTIYLKSPYQYSVESSSCIESRRVVFTAWCLEIGIEIHVCPESFTVQALHDGLLVTTWTTAQKIPQHRWSCSAQLATILVFLTTLTIVGRCYASANAVAPLVQLIPQSAPRPLYNSKPSTSNLVLSRLFIPDRFVKSDTRIIRNNSKVPYNQNFNLTDKIRTKREFKSAQHNRITNLKSKSISEENSTTFKNSNTAIDNFSLFSNKFSGKINGSNFALSAPLNNNISVGGSDILNTTRVVNVNDSEAEPQQDDGNFQEGKELLESTKRPMPPAHAHDNESCKLLPFN